MTKLECLSAHRTRPEWLAMATAPGKDLVNVGRVDAGGGVRLARAAAAPPPTARGAHSVERAVHVATAGLRAMPLSAAAEYDAWPARRCPCGWAVS